MTSCVPGLCMTTSWFPRFLHKGYTNVGGPSWPQEQSCYQSSRDYSNGDSAVTFFLESRVCHHPGASGWQQLSQRSSTDQRESNNGPLVFCGCHTLTSPVHMWQLGHFKRVSLNKRCTHYGCRQVLSYHHYLRLTWTHCMSVWVFLSPEYPAANILATVHFLPWIPALSTPTELRVTLPCGCACKTTTNKTCSVSSFWWKETWSALA